jgi:RNAse (barnase) inhibitor barstar
MIIDLDASSWKGVLDFYDALLKALGAPQEHGKNVNAVIDSVIYGGINQLKPPLTVRFHGTRGVPDDVKREVVFLSEEIAKARDYRQQSQGRDAPVKFEVVD